MEIYVIRHTKPFVGKDICYGQSDVPIGASFRSEACEIQKLLPRSFDVVYSSPLMRCYELARILRTRKRFGDDRLLEMNFGDWEMKEWNSIDQTILSAWMKNFVTMRVPNGESFIDLNNRVGDFIRYLAKQTHKRVAVVTHAGVIRCVLARTEKIPLSDVFSISLGYSFTINLQLDTDGSLKRL